MGLLVNMGLISRHVTDQATPLGEVVSDGFQAANVIINSRAASSRALTPHHTHPG